MASIDYVACDAYAGAYLAANKYISWLVLLMSLLHDWHLVATAISKTFITQIQQALSTIQADGVEELSEIMGWRVLPHLSPNQ